jgi:hypothetical protein
MYEISNELEHFLSKQMTGNSEKTFPFCEFLNELAD